MSVGGATAVATRNASIDDLLRICLMVDHGDAYVVLDGRKEDDLPQRLREVGAECWCLLSQDLDPVLNRGAPYLVRLHPQATAVTDLLRAVWGRRGGIALCTPAGSDGFALREHLRGWLRVPAAGGRIGLFRFYDPRVLRAMLPNMAAERRDAFLGPLGRLYVEGMPPAGVLEFSSGGPPEGLFARV